MSELEVEGLVWTTGGGKPFLVPACLVFLGTGDQPSPPGHVAVVPREPDTAGNVGDLSELKRCDIT